MRRPIWTEAYKHCDGQQIVALVSLIAMINASNRLSVILNYQGGAYQPGAFTQMAS